MTRAELRARFPNASEAFLVANLGPGRHKEADSLKSKSQSRAFAYENHGSALGAIPEQIIRNEYKAAHQGEAQHPARISVRITSFRRRHTDADGLCPKYFLDCCRYAGLIPDDTRDAISFTIQEVQSTQERTEIEIL